MNQAQQIADSIPHEYREKILLKWLPEATATLENVNMKMLFDAWYIYVDPNGIKNPQCGKCVSACLNNWNALKQNLIEAERQYNLIESLIK